MNPGAGGFERVRNFVGVLDVALGDGNNGNLGRREPYGEGSSIVLNQNSEETLDRAIQRTMHHQRLMALAVFAHVFKFETLGQIEVELHGGKLPETANGIDEFYVDLGTVEGGFAEDELVGNSLALEHGLERILRHLPLFGRAYVVRAVFGIPAREFNLKLLKAKGVEHADRKVNAAVDFAFNLIWSTEDMRIVLGKATNAHQSVHDSGTLITINGAEFAEADGQVAVGAELILVNQDVERAVHGFEAILGVIKLHGVKHVLGVEAFVA